MRWIIVGRSLDEKTLEANGNSHGSASWTHVVWAKPTQNGRNTQSLGGRKMDGLCVGQTDAQFKYRLCVCLGDENEIYIYIYIYI